MKIDVNKLKEIVGENNVRDNIADLYVYSSDASVHSSKPDAVAVSYTHLRAHET